MLLDITLICYCIVTTCLFVYMYSMITSKEEEIEELYDLYYDLSNQVSNYNKSSKKDKKVIEIDRNPFLSV